MNTIEQNYETLPSVELGVGGGFSGRKDKASAWDSKEDTYISVLASDLRSGSLETNENWTQITS